MLPPPSTMETVQDKVPPRGYTKLANFMVDKNHLMLKKYKKLAARDLLYLQAELCDLAYDHDARATADVNEPDIRGRYDREWYLLQSQEPTAHDTQWQLALKIRAKLREYYAAIRQYREIDSITRPTTQQQDIVYQFTYSESLGGNCGFLGRDLSNRNEFKSLFDSSERDDLLFVGENFGEDDFLTHFLLGPVMQCLHQLWKLTKKPKLRDAEDPSGCSEHAALHHYSEKSVRRVVRVLGSVISSVIPTVSVTALCFVDSYLVRLGLVCLFTFLFSLCMAIVTNARRIEVFAATAAFASVQVVFIGTTSDPIFSPLSK